ncbi:MAG: hypothetical protein EOO06_19805 [Chitinophagaceae bacterium]|nr:MAG: hypothetical protein EOO06_19805 [Chitinophagaceae bacterium]
MLNAEIHFSAKRAAKIRNYRRKRAKAEKEILGLGVKRGKEKKRNGFTVFCIGLWFITSQPKKIQ